MSSDVAGSHVHPSGRLLVVGTPIGNLADGSSRMADALASADVIACEDTRRTGRLLSHLGISGPKLVRSDDHTEFDLAEKMIERIARDGIKVAVVTDAGMPGLSDPGARLVQQAIDRGVPIEVIPGPFAGAIALVGSGLVGTTGRFVFEGFLPRKGAARDRALASVVSHDRPTVIYESPHRLVRTLADLAEHLGSGRSVALAREMTKLHEEFFRGTLQSALEHLELNEPRGEFVIVVDGAPAVPPPDDTDLLVALGRCLDDGMSVRDSAEVVAARLGVSFNRVRRLALDQSRR